MIKMFKNRQKFCLLNKKENNENEEMEEIKPKPITKEPDENNNENTLDMFFRDGPKKVRVRD